MSFTVVDRPNNTTTLPDGLEDALIGTVESGKAIQLTVESRAHYMTWQTKVRMAMRQRGFRLRTKFSKSDKVVTAWVEAQAGSDDEDEEV